MRKKLLVSLVSTLVLLLMLEFGVRVRSQVIYGVSGPGFTETLFEYDAQLNLRTLKPGYERDAGKIAIAINSLGFRGDEITREKPVGTIRIACMGASTTFCTEASSNEAVWPQQLQALLNAAHPEVRFEVINAGIPGYTLDSSVRRLEHHVLPLDPDLVLFYHANNDIAKDTEKLARQAGLVGEEKLAAPAPIAFLTRISLLADLALKNIRIIRAMKEDDAGKLESLPEDLPAGFVAKLGEARDLLQTRGIPMALSTFVVKYRPEQERDEQIVNANVAFYYMPWMSIDLLLDAMKRYNDAIVDFAHARDVPVLTDTDSIPADDEHFADCMHLTDAGCRRMAQRFFEFLEGEGLTASLIEKQSQG